MNNRPDASRFRPPPAMLQAAGLVVGLGSALSLPPLQAIVSVALGTAMLMIATIDADRFIIPDWLSLPTIPAGLIASGELVMPSTGELVDTDHILGAVIGGVGLWVIAWLYLRWRGEEGLGMGDVKLGAAAGAWVGTPHLPLVLLLSAGSALLLVLVASAYDGVRIERTTRVPFGVFLAPSIWLVWLAACSSAFE